MSTANDVVIDYVIRADADAITCPGCRECVPVGGLCSCPVKTAGPGSARRQSVAGCITCDGEKERGNTFFPAHDASPRCESGKRSHCTCDTCF